MRKGSHRRIKSAGQIRKLPTIQPAYEPFLMGGQLGRHNRFRREATSDLSPQEFLTCYSSPASACVKVRILCSVSLQPPRQHFPSPAASGPTPQEVQIWFDTSEEVTTLLEGLFWKHFPSEVIQPIENIFTGFNRARQASLGRFTTEASFRGGQSDPLLIASLYTIHASMSLLNLKDMGRMDMVIDRGYRTGGRPSSAPICDASTEPEITHRSEASYVISVSGHRSPLLSELKDPTLPSEARAFGGKHHRTV